MLIDVRTAPGYPCTILGTGRTVLPDEYRCSNRQFILDILSPAERQHLREDLGFDKQASIDDVIAAAEAKFLQVAGIRNRYIFPETTAKLGAIAAQACLENAKVPASDIDAIIVGTNTGTGYPSTATLIKGLINAPVAALCFDAQEACPIGAVAVYLGWQQVRLGAKRVLVIGAEKAITLPAPGNDYKSLNLFGCEAFAFLLGPHEGGWNDPDDFLFFSFGSDPFDHKSEQIRKTSKGFIQNGKAVHKYVGGVIPTELDRDLRQLNLDPATIDHFFPHQPSVKTLDFLVENLQRRWPTFRATVHRNVEDHGNTSAACTGWMIDRARREGVARTGQLCLVSTFGSGLSSAAYAFHAR